MESYISKDAQEQPQQTEGSTSPIAGVRTGITVADIQEAREFLLENDLFKNALTEGMLFDLTPYVDPSPDFHKTRVIPTPPRRVDTAIRKTICAIRHIPSGEYVTKGFRSTTKNPEWIKFWNRKEDAKKVLTNWCRSEERYGRPASPADFEFIEREVFLPSSEVI